MDEKLMRVIVATHHHFNMLPDGTVYPYAGHDYKFLSRYLKVFDEVIVFSRLRKVEALDPKSVPDKASGPGVAFLPVPYFKGALSYLRNRTEVFNLARQIVQGDDAFILRMPSHICTIVWRELMKAKHPYGVEMMADPWEGLSPGSLPSVLRPFLRRKWTQDVIQQCRHAATAAYVTKFELQKRYPPGGWATYYSSVELSEEIIVNKTSVEKRIERIRSKVETNERWRICFVGSLWHLVKAPDILISAVAGCVRRGINLELTIIGGGSFRQQLEVQARQQGIADRTVFLGQLPPGEAIY
jgi:glycosyltransferase involved in cell wall biosynthesis